MRRLKKGDKVRVISGNHKGSEGIILSVDIKRNTAIVENVNMGIKHKKPTQNDQEGGIIEINKSLHLSNLAFIDEKSRGATSKISYKFDKNGIKNRFARKSQTAIKDSK